MAPNMAKPTTKPMAEVELKVRFCSSAQGDDRLGRPPLHGQEETTRHDRGHPQEDDGGREPPVGVAPERGEQDQAVAAAARRAVPR